MNYIKKIFRQIKKKRVRFYFDNDKLFHKICSLYFCKKKLNFKKIQKHIH